MRIHLANWKYDAYLLQDDEEYPVLLVDGYNVLMRRLQLAANKQVRGGSVTGSATGAAAAAATARAGGVFDAAARGSIMGAGGTMEVLREELVNDTRDYALTLRCRAIVVFDAYINSNSLDNTR
jgi:hypothetical protein